MSFQRPTPRTDAVEEILDRQRLPARQHIIHALGHARDLERECDEMRQAIKEFDDLARWLAANSSGLPYRTANAIVARCRPFLAECGQYADKHLAPAPSSTPADTSEALQKQTDSVVSPAGIEPATT